MIIIPVITAADGSISAAEAAPADAICTITTPSGCEIYMPGDEELLANRLAVQSSQSNEESQ